MKALADGLAVSLAIERYLKTGGMNEPFRKEGTLLNLQTNGIERADRVVPANGESSCQHLLSGVFHLSSCHHPLFFPTVS